MPNMEYCLSTGVAAAAMAIAAAAAAAPPWAEWAAAGGARAGAGGGRSGKCNGGINSRCGRGRHSFTGFSAPPLTRADSLTLASSASSSSPPSSGEGVTIFSKPMICAIENPILGSVRKLTFNADMIFQNLLLGTMCEKKNVLTRFV